MADYTLQLIGDLNGARKPARGSTDARFAARTALEHANRESKVLRRMTITGSVGAQARQIDALLHSAESTMALYEEVFTYGDVVATLSAAVEINNNFEHLAHTLRKSTPPHPVGTVLYQAYRLRLDEMAKSFEAEVIVRYEAIGKKARSAGIDTAATRYAVERLHAHDPLTFPPPPHDATPHIEERTLTARLLTSAEASQ